MLIGAVGLVKGSVPSGGKTMVAVCDEFEPDFERTGFLNDAPFEAVSLILRYGTKWGEPELGRINVRHSELEVGIEMPISEIRMMAQDSLLIIFKRAALEVLVAVASKYGLDGSLWKTRLANLGRSVLEPRG